ncbi:hypothetical protein CPB86DRAFT_826819 [Serendipita vermifera]|nr:hypothetical protein CPB86DRAFT_826819 [Serendipita vermifera]
MSTQENLERCEDKDKIISKRIDEVKVLIEKFKQQQQENARRITGLKWSLSTARRLPDDVLIEVLKTCVLDLEVSPYLLAQVSKKFQSILLCIPKIWSRIQIDSSLGRWDPGRYYGLHGCNTVEDLRKVLKRSRGVSLDITFHDASEEMIRLLLMERHRWRYLQFHNSNSHNRTKDPSEVLFEIPNSPMNLQELGLGSECHENIILWVAVAKPQILKLYYRSVGPFTRVEWWGSLTTLHIWGTFDEPDLNVSVSGILKSLRLQLLHLTLVAIPFTDFDIGADMEFPCLQHLHLERVDHWWKFIAPKLITLNLYPLHPAPLGTVLTYPSVAEFQYQAYSIALSWKMSSLPRLVSIQLEGPTIGTPGFNFVWSKPDGTLSQLAAKEIAIRGSLSNPTCIGYKDLIASLRHHTNLIKLQLFGLKLPISFYKAFVKGSSQKDALCPQLQEFVVDLNSIITKLDPTQYHEVFEAIATERRQGNSPLRRLYVTWRDSSGLQPRNYMAQGSY